MVKPDGDTLIEVAQRQLAEFEVSTVQTVAVLRAQLIRIEEENRELRRESLQRRTEFYTEREFAQLLKVSESTIDRLRRVGKLKYMRVGNQIRYSSEDVAFAQETFAAKDQVRNSVRRAQNLRR